MKLIYITENRKSAAESNRDLNRELASNQKVKALAIEYERVGKNFSRLPLTFKTYLKQKKAAYRDYTLGTNTVNSIWYPSDIIVARNNGLPDKWMEFIDLEKESNQKVKELAIAYTKLGEFAKLPPSPEFRQFLNCKRAAYRDFTTKTQTTSHVWYPSDIIVARDNGLPDNWMEFIDLEKESNQKVKALAIEYERVGKNFSRLPLTFKTYLKQKKAAYRDYTLGTNTVNSIWYPSDIIVARNNGLPDKWMVMTRSRGATT